MTHHLISTPVSPSNASSIFDASFDSIESLPTTFVSSVVPVLETTTVTEVTFGYPRNGQYSITAMTTSSGAVADRNAYTAYGQPTIVNASGTMLTSSAASNRYTYTDCEWDETLGLHHFLARWMSTLAGRFVVRELIGYEGRGMSTYLFVENYSSFRIAPDGLCYGNANHPNVDPQIYPIGFRSRTLGFVDASVTAFACTGNDDLKVSVWLGSYGENTFYTDIDHQGLENIECFWGGNSISADRLGRFTRHGAISAGDKCRVEVGFYEAGCGRGGCPTIQISVICPLSCEDCRGTCSIRAVQFHFGKWVKIE